MKGEDNIDENYYNRYENMDIRPIKKGKEHIKALGDTFFDSIYYWVIMGLLMTIFSLLLFIFRKRAIERTDLVKLKEKNGKCYGNRCFIYSFVVNSLFFLINIILSIVAICGKRKRSKEENRNKKVFVNAENHGYKPDIITFKQGKSVIAKVIGHVCCVTFWLKVQHIK